MTTLANNVTYSAGTYVNVGVTLASFFNSPFNFSGYVNAIKTSADGGTQGIGLYLAAYDAASKGLINWSVANTGKIIGGEYGVQFRGTGNLVNSGSIGGSVLILGNYSYGYTGGGMPGQNAYGTGVGFFQSGTLANSGSIGGHVGVYLGEGGAVTNSGQIGGAGGAVGVKLQGVSTLSNAVKAVIVGSQDGVAEYGAAVNVTNAGTIESQGSTAGAMGTVFAAVTGNANGGQVSNAATGLIQSSGFGVSLAGAAGTVVNAGTISGGAYAVHLATGFANRLVVDPGAVFVGRVGGGNPLNATVASTLELGAGGSAPGTLTGFGSRYVGFADIVVDGGASWVVSPSNTISPGYKLSVSGTVTNLGTVTGLPSAGAGITLSGGSVVNAAGARINGSKYGVRGIGAGGLVNDAGIIAGTAGSGVVLTRGGTVVVAPGGTITGVDFGVTIGGAAGTVIAAGSIAGAKGVAVAFAASFANRLEVYPGVTFTGKVEGGGAGSTLELGSAAAAGVLTGFGSQYLNFGTIALYNGAQWSVDGPIPAGDTVAFSRGGTGLLNIDNPGGMAGTITGFSPEETIGLSGIVANATDGTIGAGNTLIVTQGNGPPQVLTFDPNQSFAGLVFKESVIGGTTDLVLAAPPGPVLAGETPLALSIAGTGTITSGMLSTTEVDDPASALTYTVTGPPAHGTLRKNGAAVTTFTQDDINKGLIGYQQNGDSVATDAFAFTLADQYGHSLTGSFPISVILAKPVITVDTGITLGVGDNATIVSTELQAAETGVKPAQLIYSLTAAPKEGGVLDNGVAVTSFSQADINDGQVIYQETGGTATADPLTFSLTDPNKNTLTGTFVVKVIPVPVLAADTGLTVVLGNTGTITQTDLLATETNDTPDQLTYTVNIAPLYGELFDNGVAATSFTQADINSGLLTYRETGAAAGIDSFSFTIADQYKNTLPGTFRVTVAPKPVIATDAGLILIAGATAEITSTLLDVTDTGATPAQLVYTVTTAPEAGTLLDNGTPVTSFTQDDIDNGVITYQQSGTAAADGFGFVVTGPNNGTVTGAFAITIQGTTTKVGAPASGVSVASAYLAVMRVPEPGGASGTAATTEAADINAGQQTETGYVASLIGSEQALYTTEAALITIDAFYGATPSSALLTTVATATSGTSYYTATELNALGYSDTNVWTILGSGWSADHGSAFFTQYGSLAGGTTADYTTLINELYTREFGAAPSATNLGYLLADVPGTQALLNGGGNIATPIQVMGGIYGYLLEVGEVYGIGQYGAAANAFLQAAANGTVVYGPELTQEFPTASKSAAKGETLAAVADPVVVQIAGSHELTDPGAGNFTIRFLAGAGADTLMLPAAGTDTVSGFDPATDVLDLRTLLAGTGLGLNAGLADLSGYLSVVARGADAVLRFDPDGPGGGQGGVRTVAVLQGLGGTVTGLNSLIALGAIRIG